MYDPSRVKSENTLELRKFSKHMQEVEFFFLQLNMQFLNFYESKNKKATNKTRERCFFVVVGAPAGNVVVGWYI